MFAGALAPHKGVNVLLEARSGLRNRPPLVLAGIRRFDTPSSFPHGVIVAEDVAREEVLRAWGPLPCSGISLAEALRPCRLGGDGGGSVRRRFTRMARGLDATVRRWTDHRLYDELPIPSATARVTGARILGRHRKNCRPVGERPVFSGFSTRMHL
jgi:hypothetical protein